MEIIEWWCWWLRRIIVVSALSTLCVPVNSNPQINLLNSGCSSYNVTDIAYFFSNLNASFANLRSQLSSNGTRFAIAQQPRPAYMMTQCRNYLSGMDCLACYDAAVALIRTCSPANGARVLYDGCFLRYESNNFYNQSTDPGSGQICSNRTVTQPATFNAQGQILLTDLQLVTPRIKGYFAATTNTTNGVNSTIYGVAQCVETIDENGCDMCLAVAYENIRTCLPSADGRAFGVGCFLRYSDTRFFAHNQIIDITPFLRLQGSSRNKGAIIGIAVGGLVLILVALFLCYKLSRNTAKNRKVDILWATELQGPNIYRYKDLKRATNNFSEENKLGEGGFGDVYKATLKNGNIVAVKRLDISSGRAKADFETEVRLISNVHHRNLVRLLGYCSKGSELLLVYEYMANRSLDRYLYGPNQGTLNWKQRFDIIFGTARGLAYLHEQYHVTIIHRDIKPGNILLDDEFQAKIQDFGLVRLLPQNKSHVSSKFAGTLGYTAPEYAIHGHLSEKVDIYGFGVVILEIISGRRGSDMNANSDTEYLLEEAWKLYDHDMHEKLADETLNSEEYRPEDLKKMVEIALICTQSPPSSRPTMSEILVMLLSLTDQPVEPKPICQPLFSYGSTPTLADTTSLAFSEHTSIATNSFSQFTGR